MRINARGLWTHVGDEVASASMTCVATLAARPAGGYVIVDAESAFGARLTVHLSPANVDALLAELGAAKAALAAEAAA